MSTSILFCGCLVWLLGRQGVVTAFLKYFSRAGGLFLYHFCSNLLAMENQELRDVFLAEAVEMKDALDRILTTLERQSDKPAPLLAEAFRHLHTLKGNATAMGITGLANLAHALEDILAILQQKPALLSAEVIGELFRANDKLNESLLAWKEGNPAISVNCLTITLIRKDPG